MIGLFSFDGPMYKDINGIYCNTTITTEMFSRYFSVVDKLIVVIRTIPLDKTYEEASLKKVELDGLEIVEIQNLNTVKGFLIDKRSFTKIIEEQVKCADLIFARMPSVISDIAIKSAKKMGKKYMVEVGGCAWDSYWNHGLLGKCIAPYMFLNEFIGIRNAEYASYVTESWLQRRYPCKGHNISASNVYLNPLDKSILENRIDKINSKKSNEPFIIGTTAAVDVRYKGQEYIIRAISNLNKRGYNFEYELVGGGDCSFLKNLAIELGVEDKVRFKGLLLHEEVFDWLDSIDIYSQPSKQEGLPRALVEAMSRACPSIGSTTAGIPELLQIDVVFKNGDIGRICRVLEKFNLSNMKQYAHENFEKAKEYELEYLNKKRNNLYNIYKDDINNK